MNILIIDKVPEKVKNKLEKKGFSVDRRPDITKEEIVKTLPNYEFLIYRTNTHIDKDILDAGKNLFGIARFGVGLDHTDISYATEKNIAVFNDPFSNIRSVAELIVGSSIMLSRDILRKSSQLHAGHWNKDLSISQEILGKTIGIIGFGNIGSQISKLVEPLGMKVQYYDLSKKLELGNEERKENLVDLLRTSDIISINVPGGKKGKYLIGEKEIKQMKRGAIVLNYSRGENLDTKALAVAIKSGHIAGAAIDVFENEPEKEGDFDSPLRNINNVILTPHIAGTTDEAINSISDFIVQVTTDFLEKGDTSHCVNLPRVISGNIHASHRLIHIYKSKENVQKDLNEKLQENNVKYKSQIMKCEKDICYLVTDIDEEIKNLPVADRIISSS